MLTRSPTLPAPFLRDINRIEFPLRVSRVILLREKKKRKMVNRRFTQVATSDDEDEAPPQTRTRKRMKLLEEDIDNEANNTNNDYTDNNKQEKKKDSPLVPEDAKPIGDPIRVSGKGRGRRKHFDSFEYDGNQYTLEDPVLLVPEDDTQKPYVAIIKDISQSNNGNVLVTGQWFYRPEEAEKRAGGNWQSRDTRELFYSFHRDDVPAEAVMHKCVVHFVPVNKQLPKRKEHPGFIVQKVYDTVERKLWRLTDKDYEDCKQREIDELVKKTLERIGEMIDIQQPEEVPAEEEDQMKGKRSLRRKSSSPSKEEEETPKSEVLPKAETPGSFGSNASEYHRILVDFNVLTGDSLRDRWLERLLQNIQYMCHSSTGLEDVKAEVIENESKNPSYGSANDCQDKGEKSYKWPDVAVSAVVTLEKASRDAFSSDSMKYNQKLRSLDYNLKRNAVLARRLLNGELEPSKIISMTPNELKEGLTIEEIIKEEPDESQHMRMIDVRCPTCMASKVGLREIIQAANRDRYQLECAACGHSWYAFRDEVSMLTVDASDSKKGISTAP
ncbi:hypothetical protein RJT34_05349 [Clitoria ternatea]|uniref:Uncharacterized protein n=1 Tax=Clitoria ternatea TaxID=43366 RepID=A0AAN9PR69_CLITE